MDTKSQFRQRLDTLLEGILIIDFDWRYVYLNDVMVQQTKASKEDLLGHTIMESFPGIENTDIFKALQQCMTERTVHHFESHFVYPDGSLRWFDLRIEPDEAGVCILSLDITDRKSMEQSLAASEKRFRALIEKSADMKTMATADGRLIYGSPSITKLLGYTFEEMRNEVIFDLFHPEDLRWFLDKRHTALSKPGGTFHFELRVRHKDGHWLWCEGSVTNLLNEPGINAVVSNFRDISDKKKAEQQREFGRNNLYALINNSNDMMWSVDVDHKLITSNVPYNKNIEMARGVRIRQGDDVMEGAPPELKDWLTVNYSRAFSGEIFTETVFNEKIQRWFDVSFHPIKKDGQVIGTACHSRDITDQKRIEEELLENNSELQKTNLELDRFVYSISHDLRSPLTSILGLLSLIEEETQETSTLEHAQMIRTGINRLDTFIKNVLDYSRNNRTGLAVEEVCLNTMAREVVTSLCSMRDAANIDFLIDFDVKTPFHTDKQSLTTIMENLVSNAIKFHRKDVEKRFIKISGKADDDSLQLEVSDNGLGIDPAYHEKIFEMFTRLSSRADGSGIGLYLVKQIVEKLQGSIRVESSEGNGTTFYITLKNFAYER
ncbi:MAG: PAS domain-containing sensor histidine kinase [Flavobacterium sp.]|nr:MAG: PAS domain-containing sensor histidine kinase [Flavobacterium sp.]